MSHFYNKPAEPIESAPDSEEPVRGNFTAALSQMIMDLKRGEKTHAQILRDWDYRRGNDWYVSTRRGNRGG